MSLRTPVLLLVVGVALGACSRRTAPPAAAVATVAHATAPARLAPMNTAHRDDPDEERERGPLGESGPQEIMERVREISPYAPSESGLTQLMRDVVEAAGRGDRARVEALLTPVVPSRDRLRLVLTFEGDRALGTALSAPAVNDRDALVARAMTWGRQTQVSVVSATGEQLAQGADAGRMNPGMRRVAPMLRPLATWYRVALAQPGSSTTTVLEAFVYAAGRWLFVPEPWRYAPEGSAQAGTTAPTPAWAARLQRALPARGAPVPVRETERERERE